MEKSPIKNFINQLVISKYGKWYQILASNVTKNEKIAIIAGEFEKINQYVDRQNELKAFYREEVKNNLYNMKLGLIDIMWKSNHKILYNIEPIDNEHSYFSVIVTIKDLNAS